MRPRLMQIDKSTNGRRSKPDPRLPSTCHRLGPPVPAGFRQLTATSRKNQGRVDGKLQSLRAHAAGRHGGATDADSRREQETHMSKWPRDSREADSWFSDEQLTKLPPA